MELGGKGALTSDMTEGQRIIARACGSTALACAMHLHVVLTAAWNWRRGEGAVEPMLRRVVDEGFLVVATGGNDWTKPTTVARAVDGGWLVTGRKTFASLSPAADAAATFAVVDSPRPGAEVIAFSVPLDAPGATIDETWDAAGMRGTGSHDVVLDDVFVVNEQVSACRTWGELDRPLLAASLHALPVIYAAYLGVAEGLADVALQSKSITAAAARQVGELDAQLTTARWALEGALADIGDDPEPTLENFVCLQGMKRVVTIAGQKTAAIAAELAGGRAYARRGTVDRMIRDLRAALYHPYPPETTLVHAGQYRLGSTLEPV
jgi:alkylation response protein AidB-like acyl-CoA dehydrogenase